MDEKMQGEVDKKTKVLIVDDEKFMRTVLSDMLSEEERYDVIIAEDGTSALEQMKQHAPRIVLLDYALPDMSGLEVLRSIKDNFPKTIVIIVTGHCSDRTAVKLMLEGASDYISKTTDFDELQYKIEKAMLFCNQELRIDQLESRFTDILCSVKEMAVKWTNLQESLKRYCGPDILEKAGEFDKYLSNFLASVREQ